MSKYNSNKNTPPRNQEVEKANEFSTDFQAFNTENMMIQNGVVPNGIPAIIPELDGMHTNEHITSAEADRKAVKKRLYDIEHDDNHSNGGNGGNGNDGGNHNNGNHGNGDEHRRNHHKGKNIAIVTLSILLGLMSIATGFFVYTSTSYMRMTENKFNQAYYQLVMDMNNLETGISKVFITKSSPMQIDELNDISATALSAEKSLSLLPASSDNTIAISKFLNQAMDYTKSLSKKLVNGGTLSKEELDSLQTMYEINVKLKNAINESYNENRTEKRLFCKGLFLSDEAINPVDISFDAISEEDINYPVLIYDGPFSDNKEEAEELDESHAITESQALTIARESMSDISEMELLGNTDGGKTDYHTIRGSKNGNEVYLQLSKRDGMIVMLDCYREVSTAKLSEDEAISKVQEMLQKMGYSNVKPVWQGQSGNVLTVNFASYINGVVVYPELVKVKIALDDGELLGLEGLNYCKNKDMERNYTPSISMEKAKNSINSNLKITAERLTIVPKNQTEYLAYEFQGTYNGITFYVYIDATNGNEVNALRVVEGTEGKLIM